MKPKQKSSQTEMVRILLIVLGIGIGLFIICKMTKKEGLTGDGTCNIYMPCYGTPDGTTDLTDKAKWPGSVKCAVNYHEHIDPATGKQLPNSNMPDSHFLQIDGLFYCPKQFHIKSDNPISNDADDARNAVKYCKRDESGSNCAPGWKNGPDQTKFCDVPTSQCAAIHGNPNDLSKCINESYINAPSCDTCAAKNLMQFDSSKNYLICGNPV